MLRRRLRRQGNSRCSILRGKGRWPVVSNYSDNTNFAIEFECRVLDIMVQWYGLQDERVIAQSQKLDRLIVEEQKRRIPA